MSISKKIVLFSGLILILNGCGGSGGGGNNDDNQSIISQFVDTQSSQDENKPPIVSAGGDITVKINKPITLYGQASDPDGEISEIEWKKGDEVLATTLNVTYVPTEIGVDTLTLTVTDDDGAFSSDSINLTVVEEVNSSSSDREPLPF